MKISKTILFHKCNNMALKSTLKMMKKVIYILKELIDDAIIKKNKQFS